MILAEGSDGVGPIHLLQGRSDCSYEIILGVTGVSVGSLDQVSYHFSVRLGLEVVAGGNQLIAQGGVVLDDAVVHDGDGTGAIGMWVGVGRGGCAVGGPARVPDAQVAGRRVAIETVNQPGEFAFCLVNRNAVFWGQHGDAG